jgi:serine protein kinase
MTTLLDDFRSNYSATQNEEMGLEEYLELCKRQPSAYATASSGCLPASVSPSSSTPGTTHGLPGSFGNRVIRRYPAFGEFFGMEDAIEQIVAFFKHARQGLEEKKQILYLLGSGRRRQVVDRRSGSRP